MNEMRSISGRKQFHWEYFINKNGVTSRPFFLIPLPFACLFDRCDNCFWNNVSDSNVLQYIQQSFKKPMFIAHSFLLFHFYYFSKNSTFLVFVFECRALIFLINFVWSQVWNQSHYLFTWLNIMKPSINCPQQIQLSIQWLTMFHSFASVEMTAK